ncbi:DNA topoisomerase IB [Nocardioides jiangxiensis]|uniref:DNA topoisomerase n=1 Tax=Nocardioides jiangxiensis TaxID=3064524 RepID=A0ABT9AYQ2_9ACTN|nr:DNA topoisomerase IB [Nocardioides sp. WY-20]MDO7867716.1 DNA topoisomerase IB [Nocardioides sp. WY-20]
MTRLRRTSPAEPGWTRRRAGRGFVYVDADGQRLADDEVERCVALVIPPAWTDVWICPAANGHLQAVGTDDAGRRQYLYHPAWRERRDAEKFRRAVALGKRMARTRERVAVDLAGDGLPLERACACAFRLIDLGYFRIGNDVYADAHGSFGLTTLQVEHVRRRNGALLFEFTGKSGVEHAIEIADPAVVDAVLAMRRRRGARQLLAWRDGRRWRTLDPATVNAYVRDVTGLDVTAKDLRTWHATVLAAVALAEAPPAETAAARRRTVAAAMREVASYLGNTPAVARSSYVAPGVLDAFEEGRTIAATLRRPYADDDARQAAVERATARLLG